MKKNNTLFFFTIGFPCSEGEPFIKNEYPYLLDNFDKIIIITSIKGGNVNIYKNTTVYFLEDILFQKSKFKYLTCNLYNIIKILCSEYKHCNSKLYFLKNLRQYNSLLINAFICANFIENLKEFDKNAYYYSYWMNNHAITLSILKLKNKINRFIFRVHGYDLILERWPHNFIAFQNTCHKYADEIHTVSKKSLEYLKKTYKNNLKAKVNYLACIDNGINPSKPTNDSFLTLVSCSNIIPLKRLHLIIEALKHVQKKVRWIHFGDGILRDDIICRSKQLPSHIHLTLKGQVSQNELFDFYNNNHIDFFINVSDSEGLPFTIIEATSFGIPIIATNVGGTSEIVKDETGILLDINFNTSDISSILNNFDKSPFSTNKFRYGVKEFWENNFFAGNTYPHFIKTALLQK